MNQWNYSINFQPRDPWVEILIAQLAAFNFDTFEETEKGFHAYISEDNSFKFDDHFIEDFAHLNKLKCTFSKEMIPQKNWNKSWEDSFEPVVVEDFCIIRAPFHEVKSDHLHELIIMPKMSFGTGHHATTFLMVKAMREIDFSQKEVLDMGTGTGVLSILACKLLAKQVMGIDIEEWAVDNARENAKNNKCQVDYALGGKEMIPSRKFDVLLANINKNILIDQKSSYVRTLRSGGVLLISGFLKQDQDDLAFEFEQVDFELVNQYNKENWVCLVFQKK